MNILITGATGFIGRYLTQALLKEHHRLFALVRKTSNVESLLGLGINLLYGDIADKKSLEDINDYPIEAVFHCAAQVKDENWKQLYHSNVVGTENVCEFSFKKKVTRLVYISSVAVVSGNQEIPLREDAPYRATNLYGASKIDAERRVLEFREKGLPVAIIRPPMVYGEGEPHALGKILFLLKHRLLPLVNEGKARWHIAYVKNVVNGLLLALHKEEFLQGTFFVADEEILTVKEIMSALNKGIKGPAPLQLSRSVSSLCACLPGVGGTIKSFMKDRIYDISRIRSLGYSAQFHPHQALTQSAAYWAKHKK